MHLVNMCDLPCDRFHERVTRLNYDLPVHVDCVKYSIFQNALAYFVTALSYACKMFMKSPQPKICRKCLAVFNMGCSIKKVQTQPGIFYKLLAVAIS